MKKQLPEFLNAQHIKDILQIPFPEALNLLDLNICPVYVIGSTRRVLKKDFYDFLEIKSNKRVTQG